MNAPKEQILASLGNERTKCLVYTRVMGYHRPVESFNIGKKGEHQQRLHFEERQIETLKQKVSA